MKIEELIKIARRINKIKDSEAKARELAYEGSKICISVKPKYAERLMYIEGLTELMEAVWLAGTSREMKLRKNATA